MKKVEEVAVKKILCLWKNHKGPKVLGLQMRRALPSSTSRKFNIYNTSIPSPKEIISFPFKPNQKYRKLSNIILMNAQYIVQPN